MGRRLVCFGLGWARATAQLATEMEGKIPPRAISARQPRFLIFLQEKAIRKEDGFQARPEHDGMCRKQKYSLRAR